MIIFTEIYINLVNIFTEFMIPRLLEHIIDEKLDSGKAIIILGPRQTGKTTLLLKIVEKFKNTLVLNCDEPYARARLQEVGTVSLREFLGQNQVIFIDEAQRVKNIGITLKLITDQMKDLKLLVSGSSSLEIADEINEPLTGRKWEYMLFPISWKELHQHSGYFKSMEQLEQRIIFGMYPEVINHSGNEKEVLYQLVNSYLYKDLLSWKGIRKPEILEKLLKAIAFQVGKQVSYSELSNHVQIDKNTVNSYIDLLEKAYVIFKVQPLNRNLRNEINTSRKIYFYDTGIRNALINNFQPPEFRTDMGELWENFMMAERLKSLHYSRQYVNKYYWRTHQQLEIDLIEEANGQFYAFEFKWGTGKKKKIPSAFADAYNCYELKIIDPGNFLPFLGID
jgi:predicted AAA+ superfamily ATPase